MDCLKYTCPECGGYNEASGTTRIVKCMHCKCEVELQPIMHEEDWYFDKWHELMGNIQKEEADELLKDFYFDYPDCTKWQAAVAFMKWFESKGRSDARFDLKYKGNLLSSVVVDEKFLEERNEKYKKTGFLNTKLGKIESAYKEYCYEKARRYNEVLEKVNQTDEVKQGTGLVKKYLAIRIIMAIILVIAGIILLTNGLPTVKGFIGIYLFVAAVVVLFSSFFGKNYFLSFLLNSNNDVLEEQASIYGYQVPWSDKTIVEMSDVGTIRYYLTLPLVPIGLILTPVELIMKLIRGLLGTDRYIVKGTRVFSWEAAIREGWDRIDESIINPVTGKVNKTMFY